MAAARIGRWWIEDGAVRVSDCGGSLHRVVDFENGTLRAVFVPLLILAADDREGVHDVGDRGPRREKVGSEFRELLWGFVVGATIRPSRRNPAPALVRRKIQMEAGRVEFAAQQKTTLLVPAEWRAIIAAVVSERLQTPMPCT